MNTFWKLETITNFNRACWKYIWKYVKMTLIWLLAVLGISILLILTLIDFFIGDHLEKDDA